MLEATAGSAADAQMRDGTVTGDAAGAPRARRASTDDPPDREALTLLPECAAVLGFIVIIWTSIWLMLSQQYQETERGAIRDSQNLARAFQENTERIVAGIDQILLSVRADYAQHPHDFNLREWLRRQTRSDPFTVQLATTGPDGLTTDSSISGPPSKPVDLSDREHFRVQLDPSHDDLFISKPVLGRISKEWTVQFTRKLLVDGKFAGVVVMSLGCDELSRFYDTLELGHGVVILVGTDGIVRARGPLIQNVIGSDISTRPFFNLVRSTQHGDYRATSHNDGVERIFSFRRLPDVPLAVLVGLGADDVFESYRLARFRSVLTGGIATAIVLFLGTFWIVRRRRWIASRRALSLTLDSISQGIVMVDASGHAPVINRRAIELLGLPPETLASPGLVPWPTLLAGVSVAGPDDDRPNGRGEPRERITQIAREDGKTIEVHSNSTPFGGTVVTYTDITERKLAEARILHLAHHDSLTGLANRVLLHQRITEAVEQEGRAAGHFAIFCLDLDGFKTVNDTMGHDAGDLVLSRFAERLRALVRPGDTVARTGGDEFTMVVRDLEPEETAEQVARRLLDDLLLPVELGGYVANLGSSIGIAVYPEDGTDGRALLAHADTALSVAKAEGRGGFRRFEAWMDKSRAERRSLERDLRLAVEREQLVVYFQPQFACDTLLVTGLEALVRWPHAERGMVPPGMFIPLAEECGLIVPIGRMVLERSCALAAGLRPRPRVAVNLSPVQFLDTTLLPWLAGVLQRTGLPADKLELEVTEGVLIKDEEQALATLRGLKDLGVQIALDDFGTGYSSLSYLRRFPFDVIKIDKSFVHAQQQDYGTRAIVEAVLAMSGRLSLRVIAEGVETEEQLALLREQGTDEVQGFLLARPMPGAEVQAFLSSLANGAERVGGASRLATASAAAAPATRQRRRADR
jgi:diguanylate cyclase (GGDEF)-like protein/PAS domain S-box-containing protein